MLQVVTMGSSLSFNVRNTSYVYLLGLEPGSGVLALIFFISYFSKTCRFSFIPGWSRRGAGFNLDFKWNMGV